eukprot:TRINITY_DN4571_c0_g1_i1.p1 TRINITY_DN4571_c0_g1~~TRINITY_DN4571_c0_g1_i1.p1  ORF type:complete len:181 (+),score=49.71 TRINITY_DN4571_c0_g1_i1:178-720(+)
MAAAQSSQADSRASWRRRCRCRKLSDWPLLQRAWNSRPVRCVRKKGRTARKWLCDGWLLLLLAALAGVSISVAKLITDAKRMPGQTIVLYCLLCAFCVIVFIVGAAAAKKQWKKARRYRRMLRERQRREEEEEEARLWEEEHLKLRRLNIQRLEQPSATTIIMEVEPGPPVADNEPQKLD